MKKTVLFLTIVSFTVFCYAQKKSRHISYMITGQKVYEQYCLTYHQADGSGAQNMIPPLIKTEYTLGPKSRLIKIILNGLNGELKVNGVIYGNEMPKQDTLKNSEIAAVLTYVRGSFGNKASRVTVSEVKKVRVANKETVPSAKQ